MAELSSLQVSVLALRDVWTDTDGAEWNPLTVRSLAVSGPRQLGYAPRLKAAIIKSRPEIVHSHGIWTYPSVAVSAWHRRTRRPYLISPRGMLDPWALNNSRWKKRAAGWLFQDSHLRHAACIHALCESEAGSVRAYGLANPICTIPNGIDLPEEAGPGTAGRDELPGRKVLLYLGRIHPKKGLINLVHAWATVQNARDGAPAAQEWVLAIAGWDQDGHEAELMRLATELGIPWADLRNDPTPTRHAGTADPRHSIRSRSPGASLFFVGPQFKEDKAASFASCDAFILPSFSEGLPMVVLEAWAYGKPVLMTPQCNLPGGYAAGAALRIDPTPESIARGLRDLFGASEPTRNSMGVAGRRLVAERYTWPQIARQMHEVYAWLLGGGPRPSCVSSS